MLRPIGRRAIVWRGVSRAAAAASGVSVMVGLAVLAACGDSDIGTTEAPLAAIASPTPSAEAEATTEPVPTASATAAPTAGLSPTPAPTATAVPTATATPVPSPTPVDDTPVVVQGDGFAITEAEIAEMAAFVEATHQLEFTSTVGVLVHADIGAGYAATYQAFTETEWRLMSALGVVDSELDRLAVNQERLDRIRGVCCQTNATTQVVVEPQATELATEIIIVHELTHALHTQHPELFERVFRPRDQGPPFAEIPSAASAAYEGVPQFVAYAWMDTHSELERAEVLADLPIVTPAMVAVVGPSVAQYLNFAYRTGPDFVAAVVAERGPGALSDLIRSPPVTTEQVLVPARYLGGEEAASVDVAGAPAGSSGIADGEIGAALLSFALARTTEPVAARSLVDGWAGDHYVLYSNGSRVCLDATVAMDTATQASELADRLRSVVPIADGAGGVTASDNLIVIATC